MLRFGVLVFTLCVFFFFFLFASADAYDAYDGGR